MRSVIIEGWAILRHGLGVVVRQATPVTAVSEVTTAAEAMAAARASAPDLIVLGTVPDSSLPDLVARLVAEAPHARVVALLDVSGAAAVREALAAGAHAVLSRSTDAEELVDAVARVQRGERVLSSELVSVLALVDAAPAEAAAVPPVAGLTPREHEILARLARGSSNREIATTLYIGEATVKTHLASIYDKLGVANRHQAVARAIEMGAFAVTAGPALGSAAATT